MLKREYFSSVDPELLMEISAYAPPMTAENLNNIKHRFCKVSGQKSNPARPFLIAVCAALLLLTAVTVVILSGLRKDSGPQPDMLASPTPDENIKVLLDDNNTDDLYVRVTSANASDTHDGIEVKVSTVVSIGLAAEGEMMISVTDTENRGRIPTDLTFTPALTNVTQGFDYDISSAFRADVDLSNNFATFYFEINALDSSNRYEHEPHKNDVLRFSVKDMGALPFSGKRVVLKESELSPEINRRGFPIPYTAMRYSLAGDPVGSYTSYMADNRFVETWLCQTRLNMGEIDVVRFDDASGQGNSRFQIMQFGGENVQSEWYFISDDENEIHVDFGDYTDGVRSAFLDDVTSDEQLNRLTLAADIERSEVSLYGEWSIELPLDFSGPARQYILDAPLYQDFFELVVVTPIGVYFNTSKQMEVGSGENSAIKTVPKYMPYHKDGSVLDFLRMDALPSWSSHLFFASRLIDVDDIVKLTGDNGEIIYLKQQKRQSGIG